MSSLFCEGEAGALLALLAAQGDPARAAGERKYLKSALTHYGVRVPAIRKLAVGWSAGNPALDREDFLGVVKGLWAKGVHEARVAAAELLKLRSDLLRVEDFSLIEQFLRETKTWALVDNLSTGACATLGERIPESSEVFDKWAVDGDFWVRRAAMLSLLPPLRKGSGDFARFGRYADAMLGEKEFFIRKAIGWVLRDTSRKRPELVVEWLAPRIDRASGLTVREAARRLPSGLKNKLLSAAKR